MLIVLVSGCDKNNSNHAKIESQLERKYNTDFEYLHSNEDKQIYRNIETGIKLNAYHKVTYDTGQINIFIPFYKKTVLIDNFKEQLQLYCINSIFDNEPISLNKDNLTYVATQIFNCLELLENTYVEYNIDTAIHKVHFTLEIIVNDTTLSQEFFKKDVGDIQNQLSSLIN